MKRKLIIFTSLFVILLVGIILSTVILSALSKESKDNTTDISINSTSTQQGHFATGAVITNENKYKNYKSAPMYFKKGVGGLPRNKNYKKDMPPIESQAGIGSCTGWAVGYYLKSYQEYIENNKKPSFYDNDNNLCSPIYVYIEGLIRRYGSKSRVEGDDGIPTSLACEVLKDKGALSMAKSPYPKEANYGPYYNQDKADEIIFKILKDWNEGNERDRDKFKINSFNTIIPFNDIESGKLELEPFYTDEHIDKIKTVLTSDGPVIFSMAVLSSFEMVWNNPNDDTYDIIDFEKNKAITGYHAIACVGYDDDKAGGAFKLMNSWGSEVKKDGCIWMTYDVAKIVLSEAYRVNDIRRKNEPGPDEPIDDLLSLAIEIKPRGSSEYKSHTLDYNSETGFFELEHNFKVKDRFKLSLEIKEEYSVSFININPSGKMSKLFPEEGYSSSIFTDEKYLFPKMENSSYKIDRRGGFGTESFVIILSTDNLDEIDLISSELVDISGASNTEEIRDKAFPQLNPETTKLYSIKCNKVK